MRINNLSGSQALALSASLAYILGIFLLPRPFCFVWLKAFPVAACLVWMLAEFFRGMLRK